MSFFSKQSASRPGASQDVATATTSATSTAFGPQTFQVRLTATQSCRFRIVEAAGGSAGETDTLLPAGWVDYVIVAPGQKIVAVQESAPGKLNITEMS